MPKKTSQHFEDAMQTPAGTFHSPRDVALDHDLSATEKLQVLTNWANEIQHELESGAENMRPDVRSDNEAELLRDIERTIGAIERATGQTATGPLT